MRLVSTTLTGNARSVIGDALRSVVDWVDACILIDTGIADDTLDVARSIAGDKLVVREFPWVENFAAARNFALQAAAEAGANWSLTLDTDERMVVRGIDVRAMLDAQVAGVLLVESDTGAYAKERFLRLPATVRWSGPTHEALLGRDAVGIATLPGISFHELPKDDAAVRRKLERDDRILLHHIESHPRDPRWHYYLGDTMRHAGRYREAIGAYEACTALRGWDEEAAWACYQAAQCHIALGELHRAVDSCAMGLARHAGLAELSWLAAYASHRLGNHAQAVYWARLAIPWSWYRGYGKAVTRIGFRHLPGLYEGPYDVLRFALKAMGDEAGAEEAEHHYQLARVARLRLTDEPGSEPSMEADLAVARHSFYVRRHDDGAAACERLLARPLDAEQETRVRRNRSWYTKTLGAHASTRFVRLDVAPAGESQYWSNPTILAHQGGWLALVRSTHCGQIDGRPVMPDVDAGIPESGHVLIELSTSLAIERARVCASPSRLRSTDPIEQLDGCRLYFASDGPRISATLHDHMGSNGSCRMATARLDPRTSMLSELEMLPVPTEHQEGWMPVLGRERRFYCWVPDSCNATAARKHVDDREQWCLDLCSPSPRIAARFRGGSQLVPVDGGWLALIHEVAFEADDHRIYEHRFVRFDEDLAIISWSPPFCFRETRSIEFAAGLAAQGDRLVASFGVRDTEAWLVELNLHEVLALTSRR